MNSVSTQNQGVGIMQLILLVAAVVIGLIAGASYLDKIQPNLRDSKRLKHMDDIVEVLEKYKNFNDSYPISNPNAEIITPDSNLSNLLLDTRSSLKRLPRDPSHPEFEYKYKSDPLGKNYTITFCLEAEREQYEIGCENFVTNRK